MLRESVRLARASGSAVHVVHVLADGGADEEDDDGFGFSARAGLEERRSAGAEAEQRIRLLASAVADGHEVVPVVLEGEPAEAALDYAAAIGADVIVVGSHGRSLVFELLAGSVTQRILMAARVSVLVVPSREAREEV